MPLLPASWLHARPLSVPAGLLKQANSGEDLRASLKGQKFDFQMDPLGENYEDDLVVIPRPPQPNAKPGRPLTVNDIGPYRVRKNLPKELQDRILEAYPKGTRERDLRDISLEFLPEDLDHYADLRTVEPGMRPDPLLLRLPNKVLRRARYDTRELEKEITNAMIDYYADKNRGQKAAKQLGVRGLLGGSISLKRRSA